MASETIDLLLEYSLCIKFSSKKGFAYASAATLPRRRNANEWIFILYFLTLSINREIAQEGIPTLSGATGFNSYIISIRHNVYCVTCGKVEIYLAVYERSKTAFTLIPNFYRLVLRAEIERCIKRNVAEFCV